ncbi:MAG: RHS repeat-associated core domain-containing protein, partial [Holophagales bacterium]|nr:RHS repeat-associated core domain-containing protein [Holophagales bacterium]
MRKTWLTEKEGTAELDLCGPDTCREHITIRGLSGEVLRIFEGTERADRAWKEDTIYNGTQPLIRMENTGEGTEAVQALHHDHLGSIRQVTEWQGQQVSRHRYYPFGQEATPTSATDPVHKFTGHERDPGFHPETPLDYLHARYCNPVLGRFLSVDPARESGKADRPQSWNRFSYVVNNPLRYIDPDGRQVLAPKSVGERLEANAE